MCRSVGVPLECDEDSHWKRALCALSNEESGRIFMKLVCKGQNTARDQRQQHELPASGRLIATKVFLPLTVLGRQKKERQRKERKEAASAKQKT